MATDPTASLSPLKRALVALDEMSARLQAAERTRTEPIAIVGLGCRYPGANSPDAYWRLLHEGGDAVREVPKDRWDLDTYYDPDPNAPGKTYTRLGAFVEAPDRFDPQFFGIAPREALGMDPQQRLLLEVAWEALEHAGMAPDRMTGTATGVFVGISNTDYATLRIQACSDDQIDAYAASGTAHSVAAGRLSYVLGLQGPSVALDTACSSSLVAVHLACQSLRAGDCRTALAGGVHLLLSPQNTITLSKLRMLAPDGRCKAFDAAGDGFVEGEGCGLVVLKRLSDAQADGDNILAVIRGSAVNQDGASSGLTAPNGVSQEAVVRAALQRAGVRAAEVQYVEAHGTGTSLGDPIEVQALAAAFGEGRAATQPLLIGSVKTNIGHTQAAAGVAGLIKLVLALGHEEIPRQLHLRELNPHIPWASIPVTVTTEPVPWRRGAERRIAGVSSFGFSGTNAHVVVQEPPPAEVAPGKPGLERPLHVLTLSARSEAALTELAGRWQQHLAGNPELPLADVAFTANAGRAHLPHRLAVIAGAREQLRDGLSAAAAGAPAQMLVRAKRPGGDPPRVAFLFTGQGAQYVGMGRELYETQPTFQRTLDRCAALLQPELDRPLLDLLFGNDADLARLNQTGYAQPALFALEIALAELWKSWGVVPSAVLGHSVGEYAAACVAGVFSLEDGIRLIAARGRLMQSLPRGGTMAAIFASEACVREAIAGHDTVAVAAINGPESTVVSGAEAAVAAIRHRLQEQGIASEPLAVSHAFHSPLMGPILAEFGRVAASVQFSTPRIPFVANLTGQRIRHEITSPEYWQRHLREPVRFAQGLESLYAMGCRLFVEIGPKPTLCGLGSRSLPDDTVWLASLRPKGGDWQQMLAALVGLYARGVEIDWPGFDRDYPRRKRPMPTYPFERERYWLAEAPAARTTRSAAPSRIGSHPLLGAKLDSPLPAIQFDGELSTSAPPFLADHCKRGVAILPATAYLEMSLAAARQALGADGTYALEELAIGEPLILGAGPIRVQTLVTPDAHGTASVQLFSLDGESASQWRLHSSGTLRRVEPQTAAPSEALAVAKARCTATQPIADFYERAIADGHDYGPSFRAVAALWRGSNEALARLELPDETAREAAAYQLHPALLDAALQAMGAALPDSARATAGGGTYIPSSVGRYQVHATGAATGWSYVRCRPSAEPGAFVMDVDVYDDAGGVIAQLGEIWLRPRSAADLAAAPASPLELFETTWRPQDATRGGATASVRAGAARWIVLGDTRAVGPHLAGALEGRGAQVVVVGADVLESLDSASVSRIIREASDALGAPATGVVHLSSAEADDADPTAGARAIAGSLLHVVQALAASDAIPPPRLTVVTRGAVAVTDARRDVSPAQASAWGLARTIETEHPELSCSSIDLDPESPDLDLLAAEIVQPDDNRQVAFRSGRRYVARLVHARLPPATASAPDAAAPMALEVGTTGLLDTLELRPAIRSIPGPGEIEIRVAAAGLNFRDVLCALGMYPGPVGALGSECVGTVVATGSGVTHLQVGDEVLGMVGGGLRTHVTGVAAQFINRPSELSVNEAATIPVTFLTAEYALNRLADMQRGDRVLIHAATGGVGLAAVQLAQHAGAEIFATAGSPEKRRLLRSLGIEHVFNSRTLDFASEIAAVTGGEGVDLVLNSLAGEFIDKSLASLRPGGRFLEIGKSGIWTTERMAEVRPDVRYFPVYLGEVDPSLIQEMLRDLMSQFAAGALKPLPFRTFALSAASDAFRHMAQAHHIGKIVLVAGGLRPAVVRADATYLITGGLGALGLHVAEHFVAQGARHLALIGRHEPSAAAVDVIRRLESHGATVLVAAADVARREDVRRVLDEIAARMQPLRGVVHSAGTLDDGVLAEQTLQRFEKVFAPKVAGAWHLHELTATMPLDFFAMFSSVASVLGGSGQGNYGAANAFLDALAYQRRAAGLAAVSINWGPWAGGGMAAGVGERNRRRRDDQGFAAISPNEGLAALMRLLADSPPQVAAMHVDWSAVLKEFPAGHIPALLSDVAAALRPRQAVPVSSRGRTLQEELAMVAPARRLSAVRERIGREALAVLGLGAGSQIDPEQPLRELGLDSLMAVELRNRLAAAVERTLPATLLFKYPSVAALTDFVMAQPGVAPVVAPGPERAVDQDDDAASLLELSDEQTRELLAMELESLSSSLEPHD